MAMVTLEVPDRLQELARVQGKTLEELAGELLTRSVEEALEDAENARIAAERLSDIDSGKVRTLSHEEFRGGMEAVPD